jgi:hypothetical protein
MGKSLVQRFVEQGITEEEMRRAINLKGIEPVADERKCSVEAMRNYTTEVLKMPDAPLFTRDYGKDNNVLAREILLEMFAIWKENTAEIERLRAEKLERDDEDRRRDAVAHVQLCEMLNTVRVRLPDGV